MRARAAILSPCPSSCCYRAGRRAPRQEAQGALTGAWAGSRLVSSGVRSSHAVALRVACLARTALYRALLRSRRHSGRNSRAPCWPAASLRALIIANRRCRTQVPAPAEAAQAPVVDYRESLHNEDGSPYCPFAAAADGRSNCCTHGTNGYGPNARSPWDVKGDHCESLDCALCLGCFKDPVNLPVCGHSFCLVCARLLLRPSPQRAPRRSWRQTGRRARLSQSCTACTARTGSCMPLAAYFGCLTRRAARRCSRRRK